MPLTTLEHVRRALALRAATRLPDRVRFRAAVALILREGERGLDLLFIRRAEHPSDPWSGQIAFPGGRAEPGDAGLRETAMRETVEEIGLDLEGDGELLGPLDEVRAMSRMRPMDLTIQPFVFRLGSPAATVSLSDEVLAVHWLGLDDLLGDGYRDSVEYAWQGQSLRLPCLRVDDKVIWGLTYRMFGNLEQLLRVARSDADQPAARPGGATPGAG